MRNPGRYTRTFATRVPRVNRPVLCPTRADVDIIVPAEETKFRCPISTEQNRGVCMRLIDTQTCLTVLYHDDTELFRKRNENERGKQRMVLRWWLRSLWWPEEDKSVGGGGASSRETWVRCLTLGRLVGWSAPRVPSSSPTCVCVCRRATCVL